MLLPVRSIQPKNGIYEQNNSPTRRFEAGGGRPLAIGHFNIADLVLLKAVFAAAQELSVPATIGVSERERKFMGVRQIALLVRSLRKEFDFPIFLNADHTHSLSKAIDAAKAGFDSIIFDLSALRGDPRFEQIDASFAPKE
jgi:fructose/tagatose bisphosphate aldolase